MRVSDYVRTILCELSEGFRVEYELVAAGEEEGQGVAPTEYGPEEFALQEIHFDVHARPETSHVSLPVVQACDPPSEDSCR